MSMFVPPGYRFHPTDTELVGYYLFKKLTDRSFDGNVIPELDMLQMEPWELPGFSALNDSEWYFFSPRDKKYPKGSKSNRATPRGYWKSTGRDRPFTDDIPEGYQGVKKTLVFYLGRGNLGSRTDWVMHEFRMEGREDSECKNVDTFVLCRIYNKKGSVKTLNRSRAKRYMSSCDDYLSTRSLKEPKLDPEQPDLVKVSAQTHRDVPSHSDHQFESNFLDAKNEHDIKSDICFDHDPCRLLEREVDSLPSTKSDLTRHQKLIRIPNQDVNEAKVNSARSKPGIESEPRCIAEGGCKTLATTSDLSADESVASFQDHEIDNLHSLSRIKKESVECKADEMWESGVPPHINMGAFNPSVEEIAKIDSYNLLTCRNFSGMTYLEYLSYSFLDEAMKKAGTRGFPDRKGNEDCTSPLTPLARRPESPLSLFGDGLQAEDCMTSELDFMKRATERLHSLDNNLIKTDPNHGSAFVKFCSAQ